MEPDCSRRGIARHDSVRPRWRGGFLPTIALFAGVGISPLSHSAENGLSNFTYGAQTTYAAWMPPPGVTSFFGYSLYLNADSVRDRDGDKVPGVEVQAVALAPRIIHTWRQDFFGWKMTSGGTVVLVNAEVKLPGADDRDFGPSVLGVEPLYLSRTFGTLTYFTGPFIYFPIGNHDRDALANSDTNYFSVAWQASVSWNPNPRTDVSINAAVEWKEENDETNYESGDQASVTFGAGYKPFADLRWDLGLNGYFTDGLSDDRIDGLRVAGGGRTRKFAIGPKFVFWPAVGTAFVVQYQKETLAENGPKGDLLWVECAIPF